MITYFQLKRALEKCDPLEKGGKEFAVFFHLLPPSDSINYELSTQQIKELMDILKENPATPNTTSSDILNQLLSQLLLSNEKTPSAAFNEETIPREIKAQVLRSTMGVLIRFFDEHKQSEEDDIGEFYKENKNLPDHVQRLLHICRALANDADAMTIDQAYELCCLFSFEKEEDEFLRYREIIPLTDYYEMYEDPANHPFSMEQFKFLCLYQEYQLTLSVDLFNQLKNKNLLQKKYTDAILKERCTSVELQKRISHFNSLLKDEHLSDACLRAFKLANDSTDVILAVNKLKNANLSEDAVTLVFNSQNEAIFLLDYYSLLADTVIALYQLGYLSPTYGSLIVTRSTHFEYCLLSWEKFCNHGGNFRDEAGRDNLNKLISYTNTGKIAGFRFIYNHLREVNQDEFNHIMRFPQAWEDEALLESIQRIPPHLFTHELFLQLVDICDRHFQTPGSVVDRPLLNAIEQIVNNTLGIPTIERPPRNEAEEADVDNFLNDLQAGVRDWLLRDLPPATPGEINVNTAQSTHVVSVHESISESATKLQTRYGPQINTPEKSQALLKEITEWFHVIPDSNEVTNKPAAAKRAFFRIREGDWGRFCDRRSNITTNNIILLTWLAAHDEKILSCPISTAEKKFLKGFYDCQRGYNRIKLANEKRSKDDGSPDKVICIVGTFNKIPSTLWGIHPDVDLKYITRQTATYKMFAMVKSCIKEALQTMTAAERATIIDLWDRKVPSVSDNDNVGFRASELLWDRINLQVINIMRDDGYEPAYRNTEEMIDIIYTAGIAGIETKLEEDKEVWLLDSLLKPYRVGEEKVSGQGMFSSSASTTTPSSMPADTPNNSSTPAPGNRQNRD